MPRRRRVYSMFILGFDVDMLEIHLWEVIQSVDLVCLLESTRAHFNQSTKPLVWELLKFTDRFAFARSKVIHIIQDDRGYRRRGQQWTIESSQLTDGAAACIASMQQRYVMREDDVLLSGNTDEILGEPALWQLQWCELRHNVTTGAIYMPAGGDLGRGARADHHPSAHSGVLCAPTIFRMGSLQGTGLCTPRPGHQCFSGHRLLASFQRDWYVPGGAHITWVPSLVHVYLKELTATEYNGGNNENRKWLNRLRDSAVANDLDRFQLSIPDDLRFAWLPISSLTPPEAVHVPWLLRCNPDRYPYLFRRPDPRNAALRDFIISLDSAKYGPHGINNATRARALRIIATLTAAPPPPPPPAPPPEPPTRPVSVPYPLYVVPVTVLGLLLLLAACRWADGSCWKAAT
jgi:hypothetical protein